MEVLYAKDYGFCMGVTRAVEKVEQLVEEYPNQRIVTLGPLIHNPFFLETLKKKGVDSVDVEAVEANAIAVVRTHGLPPVAMDRLQKKGVRLIDATCPKVRSSQNYIAKEGVGRLLVVAGDPSHAEVVSLCGYAQDFRVVKTVSEAVAVEANSALLIAQTTFSQAEFDRICAVLKKKIPDLLVRKSICSATQSRQNALRELLPLVDGVVVVGGRSSANTLHLAEIAKASGKPSWHIESARELPISQLLAARIEKIGLTAGASTPEVIIKEVEKKLAEL